ncbi:MAG TPA: rhomboid family intramembrane serine protease [Saprospiraceae bacterium]|jgi:rhomboid protease GluP|nr:rhomboid family intramembrane serine protease [Saprospiraceae bacterium]HRO08280.1 rhomboid family intramembrane serine protease [Saprospiraceae bacterium]HRO72589.1 rhomboid family intramembrane serine protease [Saprospiraceae bacterium]HRP41171.1 rhomboid family intramembrane serine protease [Saprospiraceae bacterium]
MPLKIKWNAPVILGFALLCTVVYFLDIFMGGYLMPFFTVQPNISLTNPFAIMTLFTHVAGHASLEHLLGNLTFILLLGPIVEEKYGSNKTLQMILVTALITGLASVFIFKIGLLGASGIVFMLILLVSFTNVKSGEIPITFILVAILFLGKEFINGVQSNQIAESAHIIGGICGSIFGFNGGNVRQ